jgi:hypothetical protein
VARRSHLFYRPTRLCGDGGRWTSLFFEGNLAETSASFDAYAGELTFTMFDPLTPNDLDGFRAVLRLDTLLLESCCLTRSFPTFPTAFSAVNQSVIDAWTPLRTSFDAILAGTACGRRAR